MKSATNDKECVLVAVRIPEHIPRQIDASLDQEDVPLSGNHWII